MQPDLRQPRTQLFTIRLWIEPCGEEQHELRMQVRHVLSGETRYFRDWADVVPFLLAKMQALDAASRREGGDDS